MIQRVNPGRQYSICKYLCNCIEALKYIKQIITDIKGEIDSNKKILENFNTPLTSMDRSSRQKINQKTLVLNDTLEQMSLKRYTEHSIPNCKMHNLFQVHMEHSPRQITQQSTNQVSIKLIKLKSCQASFLTYQLLNQKSSTRRKLERT